MKLEFIDEDVTPTQRGKELMTKSIVRLLVLAIIIHKNLSMMCHFSER